MACDGSVDFENLVFLALVDHFKAIHVHAAKESKGLIYSTTMTTFAGVEACVQQYVPFCKQILKIHKSPPPSMLQKAISKFNHLHQLKLDPRQEAQGIKIMLAFIGRTNRTIYVWDWFCFCC